MVEDFVLLGTVFVSEVRDLIELVPTARRPQVVAFANRPGKLRSLGASAEARWEPGGGTSLVAAYSWQRVRSIGAAAAFPNSPTTTASLRALTALLSPYLRLGNEVIVEVGRHTRDGARVEDAVLWNATLTGEHRPWRLRYFAGLFNLLDVRGYASGYPVGPEVPSTTVPRYGRSARIGLSVGF
jgi:hypothetical protein